MLYRSWPDLRRAALLLQPQEKATPGVAELSQILGWATVELTRWCGHFILGETPREGAKSDSSTNGCAEVH